MDEMKTVIAAYDEFSRAQQAVEALLLRKYDRADISVVAGDVKRSPGDVAGVEGDLLPEDGVPPKAATTTAVSGSMLSLVVSMSALSLPAVGPLLAAGPMLGLLAGAASTETGGFESLVSAIRQTGAPEEDAREFANFVCRGGALVLVRTAPHLAERVAALLKDLGHVDIERVRRRAIPGDYPEGGLGGDRSAAE
jgi:hypothetical protein